MTNYTFNPGSPQSFQSWGNPNNWAGNIVPNSDDADVFFPNITIVSSGQPYAHFIDVNSGDNFLTRSVQLSSYNYIILKGSLTTKDNFNAEGEIDFHGGTLTAGSLNINGYDIQGSGSVIAGSVVNNTKIIGNLQVNTSSFQNNGSLIAISGNTSITTNQGSFGNFSGTTLTGGSYEADAFEGTSYTLSLRGGSAITTNNANITLGGGSIRSFDTTAGDYVDITSSLRTVAASGSLNLKSGTYPFSPLSIEGRLSLSGGTLSSSPTIAAGGQLTGYGIVTSPIVNDGIIRTASGSTLLLKGPVTGNGSLEITGGTLPSRIPILSGSSSTLELSGSTSQTVRFGNNVGRLLLDNPSTFSGKIAPAQQGGNEVLLSNISRSSITSISYTGDNKEGTLKLQDGINSISLKFIGNYNPNSFSISNGPQYLSSDPPSTLVTVGAMGATGTTGPVVCFAQGTMILTLQGERPVETLQPDDIVLTASGETARISWVGHRHIDLRRHAQPEQAQPIRIAAHAFDPGMPTRDLRLSPGHPVLVGADADGAGGYLVPIMCLINGTTIAREPAATITYWHVELDSHDILLAEGLPAESYYDMGSRSWFSGANGPLVDPDFVPAGEYGRCRPVAVDGPVVEAERVRLSGVFAMLLDAACAWDEAERFAWIAA